MDAAHGGRDGMATGARWMMMTRKLALRGSSPHKKQKGKGSETRLIKPQSPAPVTHSFQQGSTS